MGARQIHPTEMDWSDLFELAQKAEGNSLIWAQDRIAIALQKLGVWPERRMAA
jgi:hypothetical protein